MTETEREEEIRQATNEYYLADKACREAWPAWENARYMWHNCRAMTDEEFLAARRAYYDLLLAFDRAAERLQAIAPAED
jgi:hypothetical protein